MLYIIYMYYFFYFILLSFFVFVKSCLSLGKALLPTHFSLALPVDCAHAEVDELHLLHTCIFCQEDILQR